MNQKDQTSSVIGLDLISALYPRTPGRARRGARTTADAPAARRPARKTKLDDIEAEITYLPLRHFRPTKVVEIGSREFRQGDARTLAVDWDEGVDYLLIDADHGARSARWYLRSVFPRLRAATPVSVHDVFHRAKPLPADRRTRGTTLAGGHRDALLHGRSRPRWRLSTPRLSPEKTGSITFRSLRTESDKACTFCP